jgi:hypothetical protein
VDPLSPRLPINNPSESQHRNLQASSEGACSTVLGFTLLILGLAVLYWGLHFLYWGWQYCTRAYTAYTAWGLQYCTGAFTAYTGAGSGTTVLGLTLLILGLAVLCLYCTTQKWKNVVGEVTPFT